MPNEEMLQGTDRFLYITDQDTIIENKIVVPFSQVFRYINDNGTIKAYSLENFYNNIGRILQEPMYVYYGKTDPYTNLNINVWIDTTEF